jgi:hypothetical protein
VAGAREGRPRHSRIFAVAFLLAAETLALKNIAIAGLPAPVLYRGAIICLPLISTFRMLLRIKPDPEAPLTGSKDAGRRAI